MSTKDVVTPEPILTEMDTFESAIAAITAAGLEVHKVSSFDLIADNDELVGVKFLILDYRVNPEGDFGEFVSVMAIDTNNRKFVFNDGSTGIRLQLRELAEKGIYSRILCEKGLRRSDFRFDEETKEVVKRSDPRYGNSKPARTYYLS